MHVQLTRSLTSRTPVYRRPSRRQDLVTIHISFFLVSSKLAVVVLLIDGPIEHGGRLIYRLHVGVLRAVLLPVLLLCGRMREGSVGGTRRAGTG